MGTLLGVKAVPGPWLEELELREVVAELAGDLHEIRTWEIGEYSPNEEANQRIWRKYPGF